MSTMEYRRIFWKEKKESSIPKLNNNKGLHSQMQHKTNAIRKNLLISARETALSACQTPYFKCVCHLWVSWKILAYLFNQVIVIN